MSIEVKTSYKDAIRAIELYQKATRKDLPDIMNRFNRNVAFKAVSKMPIADVRKIQRFDPKDPRSKKGKYPRLMYKLASKRGHRKGTGIKTAAELIYNKRMDSRGFLKAIFIKIASDYGGVSRARVNKKIGGSAGRARGIKASITRLKAEMISGLADEEAIQTIERAFPKALAAEVKNMEAYAKKKMDANAGKFSGTLF